jgi:hypothetical protein
MSIPTVDTFEHDIAEEIRTKEASITDIASAGGDIGNIGGKGQQTSNALVIVGVLCILLVIGACIAFFFFYGKGSGVPAVTATSTPNSSNSQLASISPALYRAVGPSIGTVSASGYGYSLQLLSYSPVFAYMIRNESAFADDLAQAVGSPRDASTTTLPFSFTDVTISNQNMRVGVSGSSTVVYAFVNARALLVSSSTQGILTLANGILKQ